MSIEQATVFAGHIRQHAARYFPGFEAEQIAVQLIRKQERPAAILYRFKVRYHAQVRSIIVKVPMRNLFKNRANGLAYEKPLLFPKADSNDMHQLQYRALRTIDEYFANLHNEQFGAIHVLDYLPCYHAIFTEESSDPKLSRLILRESRLLPLFVSHDLTAAFQNAGAWLRAYHSMPKEDDVQVRHARREDFIEAIIKLTDFLSKTLGDRLFFEQATSVITNRARELLPVSLPLGLGHGDFALRNILIGLNARVTAFDTCAKWRTPIYEDIGYFLNGLKTSFPQVISQGLLFSSSQMKAYERAFLMGYFEQTAIHYPAIRLYEMLALLDKWSGALTRYHQRSFGLEIFRGATAALMNRYFKRSAMNLLGEISRAETHGTQMAGRRADSRVVD